MKSVITLFSWLTVCVMSVLLIFSGSKSMGVNISQSWISIAASSMYILFVMTSLMILFKEYQVGNKKWLFLFSLPLDLIIISLILPYFNMKMHPSILFLFDVYVIVLLSYYLGHLSIRNDHIEANLELDNEN